VDRFACDWHRLSTTDPIDSSTHHYKRIKKKLQALLKAINMFFPDFSAFFSA